MFLLGFIAGILIGFGLCAILWFASTNSTSGWENSCTGDCRQGRECNCVEKK